MVIRIGILGAARISKSALLIPAAEMNGVEVAAVASRDLERAEAQVAGFKVDRTYGSYDEVVSDPEIDAIYNPLPISLHHGWTIAALQAGKHVLCEKPFASNSDEAREMVAKAEASDLVLMEAFHWRYHPLAERLGRLLDDEVIGDIERVEASFSAPVSENDEVRHSWELSGGALMDLGCYAVQWVRFVTGLEPEVVAASMKQGRPNVDVSAEVDLGFASGATGTVYTSMVDCELRAWLSVVGTKGTIQVENPIHPHGGNRLVMTTGEGTTSEEVEGKTTYHYQLEAFRDAIVDGRPLPTGGEDAIATMEVIDAAYLAAGLPIRGTAIDRRSA